MKLSLLFKKIILNRSVVTTLLLLVIFTSSCLGQGMAQRFLGYRPKLSKELTENKIIQISKQFLAKDKLSIGYLNEDFFLKMKELVIDTSGSDRFLQPLQFIMFDPNTKKMIGQLANCHADLTGFPPTLTWKNITKDLPMDQSLEAKFDFDFYRNQITFLEKSHLESQEVDYIVILIWSSFMPRHYKRMFAELSQMLSNANYNYSVIVVNFDFVASISD